MSGIYYVYLKPAGEHSTASTLPVDGYFLLTFRSRWDSDELFRDLQTVKTADGTSCSLLQRVNPQFWCYDPILGYSWPIFWAHGESALREFNYKFISVSLLDSSEGHDWPILANPTIGPDWISGKTFYIRNRRQPNLYWYWKDNLIEISASNRTKFRIKDEDYNDERVLIRKDKVTIEPVGSLGTPIGMYVTKNGDGEKLRVGSTRQVWAFSDLFDSVGVTWFASGTQFATSLPDLGDEWELC